jgi:CRP-like cAMP-binding protein
MLPLRKTKNIMMRKITISCITCKNEHCLIKQCSPEWIKIIDVKKNQSRYKKGENIIREGDPVHGIYFILSGKVKVITTGLNEKQQIVRLANDGHILGHRGFAGDVYPIGAISMDDSLICFVENETLDEMFMSNPKFTFALMMFYSHELRKVEQRIKNIAQMNTREKVAEALLYLIEIFGLGEQQELNIFLSREDIAALAGTNAEQIIRQLTDFEKEKIISKKGKKIIILDQEELKKAIRQINSSPDKFAFRNSLLDKS